MPFSLMIQALDVQDAAAWQTEFIHSWPADQCPDTGLAGDLPTVNVVREWPIEAVNYLQLHH
jgi:hypothetical protein